MGSCPLVLVHFLVVDRRLLSVALVIASQAASRPPHAAQHAAGSSTGPARKTRKDRLLLAPSHYIPPSAHWLLEVWRSVRLSLSPSLSPSPPSPSLAAEKADKQAQPSPSRHLNVLTQRTHSHSASFKACLAGARQVARLSPTTDSLAFASG